MKWIFDLQFFAHKKGQGSSTNGRDSIGKRLGVKIYAARQCRNILVRRWGTSIHPGRNVGMGKDYTLRQKRGAVNYETKGALGRLYPS